MAGIEDDEIRLCEIPRQLIALRLERLGHALGIVGIHLTAESLDMQLFGQFFLTRLPRLSFDGQRARFRQGLRLALGYDAALICQGEAVLYPTYQIGFPAFLGDFAKSKICPPGPRRPSPRGRLYDDRRDCREGEDPAQVPRADPS